MAKPSPELERRRELLAAAALVVGLRQSGVGAGSAGTAASSGSNVSFRKLLLRAAAVTLGLSVRFFGLACFAFGLGTLEAMKS